MSRALLLLLLNDSENVTPLCKNLRCFLLPMETSPKFTSPSLEESNKLILPILTHFPPHQKHNVCSGCFCTVLPTSLLVFPYSILFGGNTHFSLIVQTPYTKLFTAQLESSLFQEAGPTKTIDLFLRTGADSPEHPQGL